FDVLAQTSPRKPADQEPRPSHRESRMPHFRSAIFHLRGWALPLCMLGFLWFTLINHVRVEWTVNPQYGYGWAVPFLCAFLIWKRTSDIRDRRKRNRLAATGQKDDVVSGQKSEGGDVGRSEMGKTSNFQLPTPFFHLLFICL